MNRFGGRVLPLLLGILFLLGAAWTCLYALFHGMPVLAAPTSLDINITAVDGRANVKLSTASAKQTITIHFTSTTQLSTDITKWNMAFDAGEPIEVVGSGVKKVKETASVSPFAYEAEVEVHLKKREETASGTLKVSDASLANTVEYLYTLEMLPWLPESGANPNTYNMQSYRFYDSHGDQLTKLTKGQKIDELIVTIKEGGISKQTYDDASKGGFSASLNYDIFEPQDRDLLPRFSETATDLPDGCISYTVVFRDLRYNGESKQLVVKIGYPQSFGLERREFTETLPEGELSSSSSSSSEESSSEVVTDPPTPRLIITSYDYGGQSVSAASNATLNLTFKNMSKRMAVDNVVVKVAMPEAFTLTNSSNTFYFERIGREREETISIGFSVKSNAEAISHAIKLTFAFEPVISDKRTPLTSEEEITIPVVQLNRMTLNAVEAPPEIYVGDASASLETSFVNKGKTPVYNVSASITGTNIKQVGQLQFFGNIESGIEKSADFSLEALEPGPVTGEIVLTYEDANMKVSELRSPFSTTAMDMGGDMPPEQPMEPPSEPVIAAAWYEGIPVWYWIVGGFMGILVVLYLVKLAKVSRLTLQEEQDETL